MLLSKKKNEGKVHTQIFEGLEIFWIQDMSLHHNTVGEPSAALDQFSPVTFVLLSPSRCAPPATSDPFLRSPKRLLRRLLP